MQRAAEGGRAPGAVAGVEAEGTHSGRWSCSPARVSEEGAAGAPRRQQQDSGARHCSRGAVRNGTEGARGAAGGSTGAHLVWLGEDVGDPVGDRAENWVEGALDREKMLERARWHRGGGSRERRRAGESAARSVGARPAPAHACAHAGVRTSRPTAPVRPQSDR